MFRIGQEEIDAVAQVIRSGKLFRYMTEEPSQSAQFEAELAATIGTEFALAMTNGTVALVSGLVGLGIGPGDEVLVPAYTFIASPLAVLGVGAIPVIVEVDETLTMDPVHTEAMIGPKTRAIMPVHINGLPCNMDAIMAIARKHDLLVIEDACQADGGSYKGKRLGSIGNAGAFSFNYFKIISCGEGGAMVTSDRALYQRALICHDCGTTFWPETRDVGSCFSALNFRINEILAAVLRVQLRRLDGILRDLRARKRLFHQKLEGHPKLKLLPSNDLDGDCGVVVGFVFEDEKRARAFAESEGVGGGLPIDTGRHVYSNWTPVLEKRGSHHPALDPFRMRENAGLRMDYSPTMCPKTLDLLSRTVLLGLHPDTPMAEVEARIRACERAVAHW